VACSLRPVIAARLGSGDLSRELKILTFGQTNHQKPGTPGLSNSVLQDTNRQKREDREPQVQVPVQVCLVHVSDARARERKTRECVEILLRFQVARKCVSACNSRTTIEIFVEWLVPASRLLSLLLSRLMRRGQKKTFADQTNN